MRRVVIVWRDNTDYSRQVIDWLREFHRRTGKELESIDPDTREGISFITAYDIVEYPTIIAIQGDKGQVMDMWRGLPLPKIDDVNFYTLESQER
jgi:hypothetical protein